MQDNAHAILQGVADVDYLGNLLTVVRCGCVSTWSSVMANQATWLVPSFIGAVRGTGSTLLSTAPLCLLQDVLPSLILFLEFC